MSEENNTCRTCMFYDARHSHCDKQGEGTHENFECNQWKAKVKQ